MRAVITVIGKDMVGILAKVSSKCAEHNVNVLEVTQSILQDMFAMIMMVDIDGCDVAFTALADELAAIGTDGPIFTLEKYSACKSVCNDVFAKQICFAFQISMSKFNTVAFVSCCKTIKNP